jgi:hypothetical protein
MDHRAGAKPSAYTPQMGRFILARIEAGETVKAITADPRMPAYCTVYHWARIHDDFRLAWRSLRDEMAAARVHRRQQARAARQFWEPHMAKVDGRRWRRPRPSSYTRAKGLAFCTRIAAGHSMSEVVRRRGMPSAKVVYRWLHTQPQFVADYVEACQWREWLLSDQSLALAEAATPATLKEARRRVQALEGRIGRLTPKTYRAPPRAATVPDGLDARAPDAAKPGRWGQAEDLPPAAAL